MNSWVVYSGIESGIKVTRDDSVLSVTSRHVLCSVQMSLQGSLQTILMWWNSDCCKLLIKQVQSRESLEAVVVFYFFLFQEKLELVLH